MYTHAKTNRIRWIEWRRDRVNFAMAIAAVQRTCNHAIR